MLNNLRENYKELQKRYHELTLNFILMIKDIETISKSQEDEKTGSRNQKQARGSRGLNQ